jgi:nucleoside 2-deoxyribosyltransferase
MKCYVAHPHKLRGTNEQKRLFYAVKARGYELVNPFAFESEKNGSQYYDDANYEHARLIVEYDFNLIKECDVLVAYCPKDMPTWGTSMEIAKAREWGKRVIVISDLPHPFLWFMSDEFYANFDDFRDRKEWRREGVGVKFEY